MKRINLVPKTDGRESWASKIYFVQETYNIYLFTRLNNKQRFFHLFIVYCFQLKRWATACLSNYLCWTHSAVNRPSKYWFGFISLIRTLYKSIWDLCIYLDFWLVSQLFQPFFTSCLKIETLQILQPCFWLINDYFFIFLSDPNQNCILNYQ